MRSCHIVCDAAKSFLGAGLMSMAVAASGDAAGAEWRWTATPGDLADTAAEWSVAANWDGAVPSAQGDIADFSGIEADTYVRLPAGTSSVGSIVNTTANKVILIGDGLLHFGAGKEDSQLSGAYLYTASRFSNGANGTSLVANNVSFCGDVAVYPYLKNTSGFVHFRADLYANSPEPTRDGELDFSGTGRLNVNGPVVWFAPRGAEEAKGVWTRSDGSAFLSFAGEDRHDLAPGAIVTGNGIDEGTFLRRVFPDGTIELSKPVLYGGMDELTFHQITPSLHVRLDRFAFNGAYPQLSTVKYREEDDIRVEINYFRPAYNVYFGLAVSDHAGTLPGTFVFHDMETTTGAYVFSVDCAHFEFADRINGEDESGYHGKMEFRGASSSLRVTVPGGIKAVHGGFTVFKGGFVKDGAGTLELTVNGQPTSTGSITAEAGVLKLVGETADEICYIKAMHVKAGAIVELPTAGLKVAEFSAEEGAVIQGDGMLILENSSDAGNVVFRGSAQVVTAAQMTLKPGEYSYEQPSTSDELPGVPAVWFDASRLDTMTTVTNGDEITVSSWSDVRGPAHRYCTPAGLKPKLVVDAEGRPRHIYIARGTHSAASDRTGSYALFFDRELVGVKSVFKVLSAREGGGSLFHRDYSGYTYQSATSGDFKTKLFVEEWGSIASEHRYYNNGIKTSWRNGYAYPGGNKSTPEAELVPLVVDFHFDSGFSTTIDNFGFQRYVGRDGRERIFEEIVYTNELTVAEIERVRAYLMKKWLNAEIDHDRFLGGQALESAVDDCDRGVSAMAGQAFVVPQVAGEGAFVKSGAGEVNVDDMGEGGARSVLVKGGVLKVRSYSPNSLPGEPYLHVDADNAASRTVNDNGKLTCWADVRGAGYPVVTINSAKPLNLVSEAQNGRTAVEFGAMQTSNYYKDYRGATYPEAEVHTVFSVLDTANGGGVLIGHDTQERKGCVYDGRLHGIGRSVNGYSDSIVDSGLWYALLDPATTTENKFSIALNRDGATRTRLNGTPVDATATGYSGGWDLVSLATYDPVIASGICCQYRQSYWRGGGCRLGEYILYREILCPESVKRVEAYLKNKWYGEPVVGYREATMQSLTVEAGATLEVVGGAPVAVSGLEGAGNVLGSLRLGYGSYVTARVSSAGEPELPVVSGTVTSELNGWLTIDGDLGKLKSGSYKLFDAVDGDWSEWEVRFTNSGYCTGTGSVYVSEGALYLSLTISRAGAMLIIK